MVSAKSARTAALAVVVLLPLGVLLSRLPASGRPDGPIGRNSASDPKPSDGTFKGHMRVAFSPVNRGAPGRLEVVGVLAVGEPLSPKKFPDGRPYEVVVTIRSKATREIVVDHEVLGKGVDMPGKGNWERQFTASYALPAGRYQLQMEAWRPDVIKVRDDGRPMPFELAATMRTFEVK